jgi:hypothetical protein
MVTMLAKIWTTAQTMIEFRIFLSLAAKQVNRNHIMPVRDTMAEATATGCDMKSHFIAWNRSVAFR